MDASLLNRFAEFLTAAAGWAYPSGRIDDLLRGMAAAAPELGFEDAESCMLALLGTRLGRREIEILARHLTVGETYFFREPGVFDALEQHVLPELIEARRRAGNLSLRIWSAACCSGEEPYSLAILLTRLLPDLADWRITLLATDINPHFLRNAVAGRYRQWSFRNAPSWLVGRFFKAEPDGYFALQPEMRRMVSFAYLNLVDDSYPSVENNTNAMDLILCRNVLMYFSASQAARVARNLQRALLDGAWLVVSATETSQALFPELAPVNFPNAVLYRKGEAHTAVPAWLRAPPYAEPALPWTTLPDLPPEPEPPPIAVKAEPAAEPLPAFLPYRLALLHYQAGRYAEAAQVLEAQATAAPEMLLLARIAANLGQLEQAQEWCNKAIAADKLNPGSYYLLAAILDEQGQPEQAQAALKRALYLQPDFVLAHFALGNLTQRLGKRNAAKHFDNALGLLAGYAADEILPESEGITAGRLAEIIQAGRART